jgi:hypothetical protein
MEQFGIFARSVCAKAANEVVASNEMKETKEKPQIQF